MATLLSSTNTFSFTALEKAVFHIAMNVFSDR